MFLATTPHSVRKFERKIIKKFNEIIEEKTSFYSEMMIIECTCT